MAQIDIKNCDVYIQDGYKGPGGAGGLVNLMAGYIAGTTTVLVDGFVGAVAIGNEISFAGDLVNAQGEYPVYKITAHSETSLNTTSITFTPGLAGPIADDAVITVLPHRLKIRIGEGNISWTEKRPIVYVKDRGLLDTVRRGDQEPLEVKLDATWVFLASLGSDTVPTFEEALKNTGGASTWISSSPDTCEPYAVDVYVIYTPPCVFKAETYLLAQFRYEDLGHDLKAGQLACSGKCNVVAATNTRAA